MNAIRESRNARRRGLFEDISGNVAGRARQSEGGEDRPGDPQIPLGSVGRELLKRFSVFIPVEGPNVFLWPAGGGARASAVIAAGL